MGKDFIPQSVQDFNEWQEAMISRIEQNRTLWGLTDENLAPLREQYERWRVFYPAYADKDSRSALIVKEKNERLKHYKMALRAFFAEFIAHNSRLTDLDRDILGLSPRDTTPTAPSKPTTQPVCTVDFSIRLQHSIAFVDSATPTVRAKPQGVFGCEIWAKVGGEEPASIGELTYIATDTKTPYVMTFDLEDAGKTVYYWLRWITRSGEKGPWSKPVSAMVVK